MARGFGDGGFGPVVMDFTPLARLGETYLRARNDAEDRAQKQEIRNSLADLGSGQLDYETLGRRMLSLGDASSGIGFLRLGQEERLKREQTAADREAYNLAYGSGGSAPFHGARAETRQPVFRSLAKLGETYNGVHIAENEDDVQRLERATGQLLSPQDKDAITRTVYGEAAGEGPVGQAAVAGVIANRARQSGMTPTDVVLAKNQFEPWSDPAARARMQALDPNSADYQRIAAASLPVVEGNVPDPTGGADHFYAPKAQAALGRNAPAWDDGTGVDIGNHRFFSQGYNPRGLVQVAQADIPAASAQNAQAFAVPGEGLSVRAMNLQKALANPSISDRTRRTLEQELEWERKKAEAAAKPTTEIKEFQGRLYEIDRRNGTSRDITPSGVVARGNAPSGYQYDASGKLVPIPGGPQDPERDINEPLPGELAARFGLADQFFKRFDRIEKDLRSKDPKLVGPIDNLGFGESGALQRDMKLGSEAMVRMLTGAGMNKEEAANEVKQYLPDSSDSAATVLDKAYRLRAALRDMQREALTGRRSRRQIETDYPAFEAPSFEDVRQRANENGRGPIGVNRASAGAARASGRTSSGVTWSVE